MASGVAFSGLASGLNTSQIIDALLTNDRSRIDMLRAQKTQLSTRVSSIGTFKSKLNTLLSKLEALRFESQVMARTAASSKSDAVSATATNQAAIGAFSVTVDQLATATRRDGATGLGQEWFDPTAALTQTGWAQAPTAGRFTVNGVAIDVAAPTSVQSFVDAINAAEASTGVRADYVLDGAGQPTKIRLYNTTTPGAPIQLGSGGDTSNFLRAAKLDTATQVGDEISSTATLGRAVVGATLANARLSTALTQATGSFTVNGVSFNWDSSTSSINSVVAAINASSANVTAAYDAVSNRLTMTSKTTGAQSVAVSDTGGNLMAALGVTDGAGAAETLGKNALFRVDTVAGGAQQSSTTNSIAGVVSGVTFTLLKEGETATVTVGQDVEKPLAAMKEFIAAFNEVTDFVRTQTKRDSPDGKGGSLPGDPTVRMLGAEMQNMVLNRVAGLAGPYSSLLDLGVSTGAVGSAVGTTRHLQLDEQKFKDALSANPQAVYEVLNNTAAGSEGVFHNLRSHINGAVLPAGILSSMTSTAGDRQSGLDARIKEGERRVELKRSRLEAQFARMESAIAQLQAQGNRLNSQLSGLGG